MLIPQLDKFRVNSTLLSQDFHCELQDIMVDRAVIQQGSPTKYVQRINREDGLKMNAPLPERCKVATWFKWTLSPVREVLFILVVNYAFLNFFLDMQVDKMHFEGADVLMKSF